MRDYTMDQLEDWDLLISQIVKAEGLDCYPQEFEICSYEDMLCYEAYSGMPSHYPHWSFGKAYERKKTLYRYNLEGLPYEMVINSDPCVAYLMRDNTLLLQILTMAHVYGHNDFFKNNRLFKEGTRAGSTIDMFKNHSDRIRNYIQDPSIGYERVERILDAAHGLRFQTGLRGGVPDPASARRTEKEKKERILERFYENRKVESPLDLPLDLPLPDLSKIPLEPTEELLGFIIEYGWLADWEQDVLQIVLSETRYFLPQIETKIMNEGWASYWHYRILSQLSLPPPLMIEFINRHNQVIRPFLGSINPYYIGFKVFTDIEKRFGREKLFEVRELERDASFLRKYLTEELCNELHLFEYGKVEHDYIIQEVSDETGWQEIRNTLANSVGMAGIPVIKVTNLSPKDRALSLEQAYDGRELELNYAYQTLKYLSTLWGARVQLKTVIRDVPKLLICDENKNITFSDA